MEKGGSCKGLKAGKTRADVLSVNGNRSTGWHDAKLPRGESRVCIRLEGMPWLIESIV